MDLENHGSSYLTMPHWPKLLRQDLPGTPLDRTLELLKRAGNPQDRLPPVVHVAGTNGKGSTIAILRAMCEAAGYKVHVYTQPHLHRFNERIVLAGREIDDTQLYEVIEEARMAAGDDFPVTFFEGTTVAAMLAFAKHPADILLMETGAGGRFDPTNCVTQPVLNVITTISFDHMEMLGHTLSQIAWHKAGIMREKVPCVLSFQPPEAMKALKDEAEKIGAPLFTYGEHWAIQKTLHHDHAHLRYITAEGNVDLPPPSLLGPHQYVNAGNAIAAVTALNQFDIGEDAVVAGLLDAHWPARLERMTAGLAQSLLPQGWELWVDGGHNMAAGHMLSAFIEESWQDKPTYIIFGTTQGKDVAGLLSPLQNRVKAIYAVPVISEPDSYSAAAIRQAMGGSVEEAENIVDAIGRITAREKTPARILIFGSLYLRVLVA